MKLHKLHFLFLLSGASCTSAIALPRKAMLYAPHHRRDHGDPFEPVQSPKPATSITPLVTSDTPTAVVIATTSATPALTASSTLSISTSSIQPTSTITSTTIPASSSTQIVTSTPTTISSSSTITPSTTPTPTTPFAAPAAPLETSTQTSSSSGRTWVLLGIFGLAFGLLGLVVFILSSTRRRARKKRGKGVKREVELLDVGGLKDEEMGRVGDVNGRVGSGEGCVGVRGNRGKEEDREKWEEVGEDEWEQGLPAYCQ